MNSKTETVFTCVLIVCAIIATYILVKNYYFAPLSEPQYVENWRSYADKRENTPVQIIEFYDYQCPYCRDVQLALDRLKEKYPNNVSISYRHYPSGSPEIAFAAAIAAECAARQGEFLSYHRRLFEVQDRLERSSLKKIAREVGIIDRAVFNKCLDGDETAGKIGEHIEMAEVIGIKSIPYLIMNGKIVKGAVPFEVLDSMVVGVLKEKSL